MTDRLRLASVWMAVAPLCFLYFYFISWAIRDGAVASASSLETVVLVSMLVRLAAVMSFGRLRRAKAWLIIDIFAADVLVIAAFLFTYEATRSPVYFSVVLGLTQVWPTAVLIVLPSFAIYRLGVRMLQGSSLVTVLAGSVTLFVLLLVPAEVATIPVSVHGLSGVSRLMLALLLEQMQPGSLVPEVTVSGLVLYLAMTFYVISRSGMGRGGGDRLAPLFVAVTASTLALGWLGLGTVLTDNLFLLFAAPGLAILGVIWWTTRGR